jgi:hypothetical protein
VWATGAQLYCAFLHAYFLLLNKYALNGIFFVCILAFFFDSSEFELRICPCKAGALLLYPLCYPSFCKGFFQLASPKLFTLG